MNMRQKKKLDFVKNLLLNNQKKKDNSQIKFTAEQANQKNINNQIKINLYS